MSSIDDSHPGLGEAHRAGDRLDGVDLTGDRPLQVDVVAAALEDLAAALAPDP